MKNPRSSASSGAPPGVVPPGMPRPGELVAGKYQVERLLGMGGMGVVLLARHLELDERVALKMLLPHVPPRGEAVARFIREARAAIKIRSEHVVRVLDVARLESGAPFIVMEYLDGSDLGQLVERDGPLEVDVAIEYVMQACEAIASAHALGIIHRDLKPGNLFLTQRPDGEPCVKVLDFGISKISESAGGGQPELTTTATIMGTPAFMSPEQLRSTRDVDARSDIWSLGAIVYALLTGAPPYDGESNADVSAKIIRDAPRPLRERRSDAPAELEAIVLRCLEKEPGRRFADVPELAQALASAATRPSVRQAAARIVRVAAGIAPTIQPKPVAAPPPAALPPTPPAGDTRTASAWGETRKEERRRRVAGMALAVLAVGALAAFGVVKAGSTSTPTSTSTSTSTSTPTSTPTSISTSTSTPTSSAPAAATASAPPHALSAPAHRPPPPRPSASSAPLPPAHLFDGRE